MLQFLFSLGCKSKRSENCAKNFSCLWAKKMNSNNNNHNESWNFCELHHVTEYRYRYRCNLGHKRSSSNATNHGSVLLVHPATSFLEMKSQIPAQKLKLEVAVMCVPLYSACAMHASSDHVIWSPLCSACVRVCASLVCVSLTASMRWDNTENYHQHHHHHWGLQAHFLSLFVSLLTPKVCIHSHDLVAAMQVFANGSRRVCTA